LTVPCSDLGIAIKAENPCSATGGGSATFPFLTNGGSQEYLRMAIIHSILLKGKDSDIMMFFEGMTQNRLLTFAMLFALAITLSGTPTITTIAASPTPKSPAIVSSATTFEITDNLKQLIRTLIDNKTNAAMVIGLVDPNGTQFYGYGKTSNATNATTVNENTLFDIGSITKTFTTTILADMVKNGTVNLDDPIEKYLPPTVRVPTYNGNKITLEDLATLLQDYLIIPLS
jgi:hypothetical protein